MGGGVNTYTRTGWRPAPPPLYRGENFRYDQNDNLTQLVQNIHAGRGKLLRRIRKN